jgi:antitoxin component of MazEF toxin-antitoxin module
MTVSVKKIGGSVAVVIPKSLARDLALVEGTTLEVTAENGSLRMRKKGRRPRRSMAAIVAQMKSTSYKRRSDDLSDWVDAPPVGREIW